MPDSFHHLPKPFLRQLKPVQQRTRSSSHPSRGHVLLIRLADDFFLGIQLVRHPHQ